MKKVCQSKFQALVAQALTGMLLTILKHTTDWLAHNLNIE